MPREIVIIECTEARKEGKSPSRYMTTRNFKKQAEKVEKMKYNPSLKRRTLHREIKKWPSFPGVRIICAKSPAQK